jgi:hypothetical protein
VGKLYFAVFMGFVGVLFGGTWVGGIVFGMFVYFVLGVMQAIVNGINKVVYKKR